MEINKPVICSRCKRQQPIWGKKRCVNCSVVVRPQIQIKE